MPRLEMCNYTLIKEMKCLIISLFYNQRKIPHFFSPNEDWIKREILSLLSTLLWVNNMEES